MRAFVGTSGYSYKEWNGVFYPDKLPAGERLGFYAGHFKTVEINNTFYRMPRVAMLEKWAAQVPEDFSFVIKAPRRITHSARLDPEKARESTEFLWRNVATLGDRLGPLLFQLPPQFKVDPQRLRDFLELIPAGRRIAVEFRNISWFDDAVYAMLRERNVAVCLGDGKLKGQAPFVSTAAWGYLRLRDESYDDASLSDWASRIKDQDWNEVYVFFKHEACATNLAQRFNGLFE